ncbi:MAG: T9SS type A sorting domain-containing protein [Bacteroidetes bacterium]|nr:T9SS type A sorting domain-containing protein [Bacteroidota bacterium]
MVRSLHRTLLTSWLPALLLFTLTVHGGMTAHAAEQFLEDDPPEGHVLYPDDPQVIHTMHIQNRYNKVFLSEEGVEGIGTGMNENGEPAILIFTSVELGPEIIPPMIEGIPVVQKVNGETILLRTGNGNGSPGGSGASATSHNDGTLRIESATQRYARPVPIGVSSNNWRDCTAGTLGVRVKNNTGVFVLSCNHVVALINAGNVGDKIVQPGRYDVSCAQNVGDQIGQLADLEPIKYGTSNINYMDAALVSTTTSLVSASTPGNGYGSPNATPATAYIGMEVQKYGRTTELTTGKVCAINFYCAVPYPAGPAMFQNQVVIEPMRKNSEFAEGGDSGALVVTNNVNANPIGLLFAKNGSYVYVSPIGPILSRFNVQIDDGSPSPLPVQLVFFSGSLIEKDVQLKWRTATELNNLGFFVQRSLDKETWTDIELIPGTGTSNVPQSYTYTDAGIARFYAGQKLYYRLLQMDRDGTEDYSSVLEVNVQPVAATMEVYPHPVRSNATVQIHLDQPAEGQLHLYDACGRRLDLHSHSLPMLQGTQIVPLSLSSVSPGYYFLEFESAGTVVRKRIMVVR